MGGYYGFSWQRTMGKITFAHFTAMPGSIPGPVENGADSRKDPESEI